MDTLGTVTMVQGSHVHELPRVQMTEDLYRELFDALGIEARELGRVLRYRGLTWRVYFNRNRHVGIYFSAHPDDEAWYPTDLWVRVDSHLLQRKDHGRVNIVPRPGLDATAFRRLRSHWEG